jgi:hypothetical protein
MHDYEKLGVFYLGKGYDLAEQRLLDDLILYDSRDLVTHAACIGMTGSGKTGLCISLLEEALIDGIPALIVDPKGDLTNLLLTFPELRREDFAPWVNPEDAQRKNIDVDTLAEQQAELWRRGLADWGQDGERIRRLRATAEFAVYTPGSNAGIPLAVLKSFAAPPAGLLSDSELLGDRIGATATSLLTLLGIDADPLRSREHILIASILEATWRAGRDLDLVELIQAIQTPPMARVGAFDIDTFFPPQDRFALAMQLNNLLASPGFDAWRQGEPLDIGSLLHSIDAKPRAAVLSIAHLGDAERMFFVSLLLNEILAWMRTQSGTTSLRAILYMDEIYGYFPPVANPPSKLPLLTLLKQARAFGLGIVLATQNPVDLDYKGLANIGTWFIGRLQTERDKSRIMDGLVGTAAAGGLDRQKLDEILSQLGSRIFLMNNVHEKEPVVFQTRWAMSYLRGPLTREQIRKLPAPAETSPPIEMKRAGPTLTADTGASPNRPALPPQITQYFLPASNALPGTRRVYQAMLLGAASIHLSDSKLAVDATDQVTLLAPIDDDAIAVDWDQAVRLQTPLDSLGAVPATGVDFASMPPAAADPKAYKRWHGDLQRWLYANHRIELKRSPSSNLLSRPGESERDFRVRLTEAAHQARDQHAQRLRDEYAKRMAQLEERLQRAERAAAREQSQVHQQHVQTAISLGATILDAFLGRKIFRTGTVGRAATTARSASRVLKERADAEQALDSVEALRSQRLDLQKDFEEELARLAAATDPRSEALDVVVVKPRKSDVTVRVVALAWAPYGIDPQGDRRQLWT